MKIFLIYGEKDAGKSSACAKILRLLTGLDSKVNFYSTFEWGDFKALVKFDNRAIAIYSPGDESAHVSEAIDFGSSNNCDILIATVRRGIAYNAPLRNIPAGSDYEWIELSKGVDEVEMEHLENGIAIDVCNKIYNL